MAVKPFTKEELNFFKFASIVHDEFPKMLRSTFVTLWNSKIALLPGYQVWDDTPAVRTLLLTLEGGTTAIPTNKSFEDWDCTALLKATIYSKTFAISTTTTIKTLGDQFIKGKKPSPFHALLTSPTGNQDETITLAIDQVRLIRNHLCHSSVSSITKPDFDNRVQLARDAFTAVGFPTDQIVYIGSLDESDFPTQRVDELNKKNRDAVLENHKFLKEKVEEELTRLTDGLKNNKLFQEHVIQKLDRIEKTVIKNRTSGTAIGRGNRGLEAPDVSSGGGKIIFRTTAEMVRVVEDMGVDTVTLSTFIHACAEIHPSVFQEALKRGFGDERDDQKFGEIKQSCLLVPLHCLTDERFLGVLDDFESGRIKERLLEEFSQFGVEMEELEIEIKNNEEVNKTKEVIKRKHESSIELTKDNDIPSTSIINSNCQTVVNKLNIIGDNNVINLQNSDMERKNPRKIDQEHQQKFISPKKNPSKNSQFSVESCIPDKPDIFIGRDAKVKQIISSLVEDGCGIVSIVGGPGFGKSTIAIEVSHQLSNDHGIVVIFSFMSHASTVSEVLLRLCNDVCVNPGENPESSLRFWLTGVATKVVLVMDNIEQLLESHVKSQFVELVRTLRKNSQQRLQILTTTRTEFSVPGQITATNHQVDELDEKSGVELLRMCCPNEEIKDGSLSELAKLCGFVPLALCIAGRLIPDLDDPSELIEWLREKPMETLRNSDQCVQQTIEFSFQKLNYEDQKGFVCLSVLGGNFEKTTAKAILEKDGLTTQGLLINLANRSLVQRSSRKRFVIHSLIRRFLADHGRFQEEKARAQGLMVAHFLKMCHSLTMVCYSYNGFTSARESLKKDIHNVEETFKICSQDQVLSKDSNITDLLANSDIYKSSYRFFHNFIWDLLTENVLKKFSENCVKLAERRREPKIKITFQYQVAAQEGHNSAWNPEDKEYSNKVREIEAEFYKNKAILKEDRYLYMSCYQILARFYFSKEPKCIPVGLTEDDLLPALPENKVLSRIEKAAEAHALMKRGNLSKKRANNVFRDDKEMFNEYMDFAKSSYNQALSLAEELLGDHELTCALNKLLGDLCSNLRKNDEALTYYTNAINLHKKLKFDSNEQFVTLLNNCGACLSYLQLFDDSVKMLMEALDIADKLAEKHTRCKALVYCQLAITYSYSRPDCQEAMKFAEKAMKMRELLDYRNVKTLEKIIQRAEDIVAVQDIIQLVPDIVCVQGTNGKTSLKSFIPDQNTKFTGRCALVKQITSSLVEDSYEIVSVVGEPGYGKSTVAVEVSYSLSDEHDIVVIFSFLSHASTIPEVITRLCLDVGVNPGIDPESSLMFWLKGIEKKVVLVMDSIEQLLERNVKSRFFELVLSLRKNSQQHLQILMTSRTGFEIPGQTSINYQVEELNEISSVELLKKCCPNEEIKDAYLSELANLCGLVPFALCIAGTLIPDLDDPSELIQWLKERPMETSKNSDQCTCVQRAIELSFEKLSDENKKALVCLSVFHGDFKTEHAKKVLERSESETIDSLKILVSRSLIQGGSDRRFVIHSLIRRFLVEHGQFKAEKEMAQGLMVADFLKTCHSLTIDCYSYNGFISARESLKKDIHNVEETLRICSQDQTTNLNQNIPDLLTSSDIYKSSSRFFYIFSWELLPGTVLRNFFESCIKLAKSRKQPAIEIAFRCLVADQEGHKSGWKSPEFNDQVDDIAVALQKNEAVLKDDRSLFMLCHFIFSQFDSDEGRNATAHPNLLEDDLPPPLHRNEASCQIEKAAEAHFLMECGNLNKKLASEVFHEDKEKSNEYMGCEESCYNQALSLAKQFLGDHELTCILYKLLGDLYNKMRKNKKALAYYFEAINLRKKLELDANEAFVFLLKNFGTCLSFLGRYDESVGTLKNAQDIAKKLSDKKTFCNARVCFALAVTYRKWKPGCQQAAEYAKEAMETHEFLDSHMVKTLEKIIQTEEKRSAL